MVRRAIGHLIECGGSGAALLRSQVEHPGRQMLTGQMRKVAQRPRLCCPAPLLRRKHPGTLGAAPRRRARLAPQAAGAGPFRQAREDELQPVLLGFCFRPQARGQRWR
jgi:hypothetical protein